MKIDKHERKVIFFIFIALALWFGVLLNNYYSIANGNIKFFYALFLLAYCFFISKFFFDDGSFKAIIIFFVILLTSDVLLPPYMFVSHTPPVLADNLKFSADFVVYSFFPSSWSHSLRYYLTYIGFPVVMWAILALLFNRKKFMSLLKRGV